MTVLAEDCWSISQLEFKGFVGSIPRQLHQPTPVLACNVGFVLGVFTASGSVAKRTNIGNRPMAVGASQSASNNR
jgi:hypothetical protein